MLESDTRGQVLDGTMECLARWGLSKTTLDDIAAASGCSRATIYRLFPGGKDALFGELVHREVVAFFDRVDRRLDAATTLDELLREGMTAAIEQIWSHPALQFLVEHEPGSVVRNPITAGLCHVVEVARGFVEPRLAPYVAAVPARMVAADWVVRMTLSYATTPPQVGDLEGTVGQVVEHLLVPGITGLAINGPNAPTGARTRE